MRKPISVAIGAALTVTLLAACSSSPGSTASNTTGSTVSADETLDDLIAAAQAEGTVNVYSLVPEATQTLIDEAFTAAYGVKTETLRVSGTDLNNRFASEMATGASPADVVVGNDVVAFSDQINDDLLTGWEESGVEKFLPGFPSNFVLSDFDAPLVQFLDTGAIINTTKVSADDIPTTWKGFATPEFKNLICSTPVDTSVNNAVFYNGIRESEGDATLTALAQNIVRYYPNVVSMNDAVAAGECAIGLNGAAFFLPQLQANGAPVEFVHTPTAFNPLTTAAVNAHATAPAAARLYLYFLLSDEGNSILNTDDSGSFGPWSTGTPAGWEPTTLAEFTQAAADTDTLKKLMGQ